MAKSNANLFGNDQSGNVPEDESLLAASGKLPKNTIRGIIDPKNFSIPNYDLREAYSGNSITFSAPQMPVGGRGSDAVFRELTNQRSEEYLTKIGNALGEKYNSRFSLTEVSMNASPFGVGVSGKFFAAPDPEAKKFAQSAFDIYRNLDYSAWAKEGIERGGVSYQVKDGQKIYFSAEDLKLVKKVADANVERAFNSNRTADGSLPKSPEEAIGIMRAKINDNNASAKTDVTAKDFGERGEHFNKALLSANGNTDVAAALLKSSAAAGHDPKGEFRVEVSTTNGALIPAQGTGPGVSRGDGVVASQVQPGTAQNVAEAFTQKNPAQQIASVEPQPEKQQAPRTV
jgi:hypothetical protein